MKQNKNQFLNLVIRYGWLAAVETIALLIWNAIHVYGNDMIGGVIDTLFAGEAVDFSGFLLYFLLLVGGGAVCAFVWYGSASAYGNRVCRAYRDEIADKLYRLEYAWFDRHNSASVLNKVIGDMGEVASMMEYVLPDTISCLIELIIFSLYIIRLNATLFLVMAVVYPAVFFLTNHFAKKLQALAKGHREKVDVMTEITQDAVSGILTLRSFGLEKLFLKRMRDAAGALVENEQKRVQITNTTLLLQKTMQWIPNIICAAYALFLVHSHAISIGKLIAFIMILTKFVAAFIGFPFCFVDMQNGLVSVKRIEEILSAAEEKSGVEKNSGAEESRRTEGSSGVEKNSGTEESRRIEESSGVERNSGTEESHRTEDNGGEAICFEGVHFGYREENEVLSGVSFQLKKGEHIAIVGESGGGKSTIFHLICGFYLPEKGSIRLLGRNMRDWDLAAARDQIALVSQDIYLFPASIRENLSFGNRNANMAQIMEACRLAEIHDFIMSLPKQYDTEVGERGALLSGGQKQRISIARALLKQAPILLLDEPTSAIDVDCEEQIQKALDAVTAGRSCITIAHRLSTIRGCDRVLELKGGVLS